MNEFILQNADRIICEPSGLTYTDLKYQLTQKIMIINQDYDRHQEIINHLDKML
jgi:hypothetical protein